MASFFEWLNQVFPKRVMRLGAYLSVAILPLLFGAILWSYHRDTPEGKGADFAYPDRIFLWSCVSSWSHAGAPPLSVGGNVRESLRPVEAVYTDDMGFAFLVDGVTRVTRTVLERNDFFTMVLVLNVLLLSMLLVALRHFPMVLFLVSILTLFPSFYIPKQVIGPDLFCLSGTFALTALTVVILVFYGRGIVAWVTGGILLMVLYFLRQAIGMIVITSFGVSTFFWFLERSHRSFAGALRLLGVFFGAAVVWLGFHGTLAWRDSALAISSEDNRASKHHTVFHPLYVGIGNMKGNPWGILYSDRFASDQILGKERFETLQPCSEQYLRGVRDRYLSIWREDGLRLMLWYLRHFVFVVEKTLGFGIFLFGMGYAAFVGITQIRRPHPLSVLEAGVITLAVTLLGFLFQSTLIDYQMIYSYPTILLGRYLLGFSIADAICRIHQLMN